MKHTVLGLTIATALSFNTYAVQTSVVGTMSHSLFIYSGQVFGMGDATKLAVFNPNTTTQPQNVMAPTNLGIKNAVSVAAANERSAVLLTDGTVVWFGRDINNANTKPSVAPFTNVSDVALDTRFMYTIIGGNVFKWDFSTTPTQLTFGGTATEISASVTHISVRLSDGTVWSWGQNNYGQLGNNTLVASTAPVQASGLSGITKVVAGNGFTVALDKYGNVFTWGGSTSYGLNTLPKKAGVYPTVKVPHQAAISTVKDIDAGAYQVIALKEDNSVWVWGYTDYINNSTTNYSYNTTYLPTNISELGVNTTKIAAGWDQMLTLGFDDKLHNWAGNNTGKLGDGTTTERHAPVSVAFTLPVVITPPLTTPPPSTTCDDDNGHGNGVGHGEGNCGHNNGNGSGGSDNGNGNSNNTPNPIVCTKVKNVTTCTN